MSNSFGVKTVTPVEPAPPALVWRRPVADGAAEWVEIAGGRGGAPSAHLIVDSKAKQAEYEPLKEEPALFLKFCDAPATTAGYLAFFNKFGSLGIAEPLADGRRGEPIDAWLWWQTGLRVAVYVHGEIASPAFKGEWIRIQDDRVEFSRPPLPMSWSEELIEALPMPKTLPWASDAGRRLRPMLKGREREQRRLLARAWLCRFVNSYVLPDDRRPSAVIPSVLVIDSTSALPSFVALPSNLVSVIWFQFAEAISARQLFKRCATCQVWFLISPRGVGRRSQAIYCGNNCKVQGFRLREREKKVAKRARNARGNR